MGINNLSSQPRLGASVAAASDTAVAASLDTMVSTYITNATKDLAVSLALGVPGQQKIIICETIDTNNVVITPATMQNGTTVTLDATGDSVHFVMSDVEWCVVYTNGAIA